MYLLWVGLLIKWPPLWSLYRLSGSLCMFQMCTSCEGWANKQGQFICQHPWTYPSTVSLHQGWETLQVSLLQLISQTRGRLKGLQVAHWNWGQPNFHADTAEEQGEHSLLGNVIALVLSKNFHQPRNTASPSTGSKLNKPTLRLVFSFYCPGRGKEWLRSTKEPCDQLFVILVLGDW